MPAPLHAAERWRPIWGYLGYYEVSDHGRVRSLDRRIPCGRWLVGQMMKTVPMKGYRVVTLCALGIHRQFKVHRLMGIAFLPNPKNLPDINHKDGKKSRNLLSNIEWSTKGDNTRHSRRVLKCCCAEKNGRSKLTKHKVAAIRRAQRKGQSYDRLAKKFHVGKSQICRIVHAVHWAA